MVLLDCWSAKCLLLYPLYRRKLYKCASVASPITDGAVRPGKIAGLRVLPFFLLSREWLNFCLGCYTASIPTTNKALQVLGHCFYFRIHYSDLFAVILGIHQIPVLLELCIFIPFDVEECSAVHQGTLVLMKLVYLLLILMFSNECLMAWRRCLCFGSYIRASSVIWLFQDCP
jgi:hypothetical protein